MSLDGNVMVGQLYLDSPLACDIKAAMSQKMGYNHAMQVKAELNGAVD